MCWNPRRKNLARKPLRQGDVLLLPVESDPSWQINNWQPAPTKTPDDRKREGGVVLAFGEVTGHAHVLQTTAPLLTGRVADTVQRWTSRIVEFIDLPEKATLVHEEHATLEVPAGKWEVIHQREYAGPQRERTWVRD
jgi:hypothetical protein